MPPKLDVFDATAQVVKLFQYFDIAMPFPDVELTAVHKCLGDSPTSRLADSFHRSNGVVKPYLWQMALNC
jgi:hypothetical protein